MLKGPSVIIGWALLLLFGPIQAGAFVPSEFTQRFTLGRDNADAGFDLVFKGPMERDLGRSAWITIGVDDHFQTQALGFACIALGGFFIFHKW